MASEEKLLRCLATYPVSEDNELICFGDFGEVESRSLFIGEALRDAGVQFLCPAQESTSTWVEEGRKHNFGVKSLEDLDSELFLSQDPDITYQMLLAAELSSFAADIDDCSDGYKTALRNMEKTPLKLSSHCQLEDDDDDDDDDDEEIGVAAEGTGIYYPMKTSDDEADCVTNFDVDETVDTAVNGVTCVDNEVDAIETDVTEKQIPEMAEETNKQAVVTLPAKPLSWASLFKDQTSMASNAASFSKKPVVPVSVNVSCQQPPDSSVLDAATDLKVVPLTEDKHVGKMAEYISHQQARYAPRHALQPRGLVNRANWCYVNANMQALLAVTPLVHFYKSLAATFPTSPSPRSTATPLTDSMIAFFSEFEVLKPHVAQKKSTDEIRPGASFDPKCVHSVLPVLKSSLSEKGRQEDAEEFLSFLLNGIHDELTEMNKLLQQQQGTIQMNGDITDVLEDEESLTPEEDMKVDPWQHIGHKNKSLTVRKSMMSESLIKSVFGGVVRSSVHQTGSKESATLQPFFTLQLDIQSESIWNLAEALESYFTKESLQGFTCSKTNIEVEASRRSTIEELPNIFIFHLKYFVYDRTGGCQKLHKNISIPTELEIPKDVLSTNLKGRTNLRNYRLFAVVYHHGKHAAGGHYTAEVHHGGASGVWLRFDDNTIKQLTVAQVTKHQTNRVPYLLFYERIQAR